MKIVHKFRLIILVHDVEEAYYLKALKHQFSSSSDGIIIPSDSISSTFDSEDSCDEEGNFSAFMTIAHLSLRRT